MTAGAGAEKRVRLKVYSTSTICPAELREALGVGNSRMALAVVAAPNIPTAAKIFGRTSAYVGPTDRANDLALSRPGTVFYANSEHPTVFLPTP